MRLKKALNIDQPYASMICDGDLPLLVKTHFFFSEDRIAIYATARDDSAISRVLPTSKIIGSVKIVDCVKVDSDRTRQMIAEMFQRELAESYPKDMMPFPKPIYNNHYLWIFEEVCKFEEPIELEKDDKVRTLWTEIDIEDKHIDHKDDPPDEEDESPDEEDNSSDDDLGGGHGPGLLVAEQTVSVGDGY